MSKNSHKTGMGMLGGVFSGLLILNSPFVAGYSETVDDYLRARDPALGINAQFGRWNGPINLVYDPDGAPALFADADEVLALLGEATGEWKLVTGQQFNVVGTDAGIVDDDSLGPDAQDGLVRVFWGPAGGAAGRAGPNADFYDDATGYYPYIDGSVELNDDDSLWDATSDLVPVLAHELGHLMGLGHSDNPDSILYANPYNHLRHPRADDILAIRALYGTGILAIDDVSRPLDQWLYDPLPAAPASATEFLFKPNQFIDKGAYISVGNDTPVNVIDGTSPDDVFVRFNYGGVGNFSNTTAIDIDATVVYVDPFGYVYDEEDARIACAARAACGGGWISIATSRAIKTIPGEWTVYVVDDAMQLTLLELPFTVDTRPVFNQPPVAQVTVTGLSGTMINVVLAVTDPDSGIIDVVWHPHGNLGDQDNDGFLDTAVTDTVQSGSTIDRDITFLASGAQTLYIELRDQDSRYDGSNPDSSGAGDGFQSLVAITVNLPVTSADDVTIAATFLEGTTNGNGTGNIDQLVDAIAGSNTLKTISTSDKSATTAQFGAGASNDAGATTATTFNAGDVITIAGSVVPQTADVGKAGEIFVVLYTNSSLSYLDIDGNFVQWGGSLKNIQPAFEKAQLASTEKFKVFSGNVQADIYKIFLGYRLTAGGPIHFNATAFRVTVN